MILLRHTFLFLNESSIVKRVISPMASTSDAIAVVIAALAKLPPAYNQKLLEGLVMPDIELW